jgi:hypothetical protein
MFCVRLNSSSGYILSTLMFLVPIGIQTSNKVCTPSTFPLKLYPDHSTLLQIANICETDEPSEGRGKVSSIAKGLKSTTSSIAMPSPSIAP